MRRKLPTRVVATTAAPALLAATLRADKKTISLMFHLSKLSKLILEVQILNAGELGD